MNTANINYVTTFLTTVSATRLRKLAEVREGVLKSKMKLFGKYLVKI